MLIDTRLQQLDHIRRRRLVALAVSIATFLLLLGARVRWPDRYPTIFSNMVGDLALVRTADGLECLSQDDLAPDDEVAVLLHMNVYREPGVRGWPRWLWRRVPTMTRTATFTPRRIPVTTDEEYSTALELASLGRPLPKEVAFRDTTRSRNEDEVLALKLLRAREASRWEWTTPGAFDSALTAACVGCGVLFVWLAVRHDRTIRMLARLRACLCPRCEYPLAINGTCAECGWRVSVDAGASPSTNLAPGADCPITPEWQDPPGADAPAGDSPRPGA